MKLGRIEVILSCMREVRKITIESDCVILVRIENLNVTTRKKLNSQAHKVDGFSCFEMVDGVTQYDRFYNNLFAGCGRV